MKYLFRVTFAQDLPIYYELKGFTHIYPLQLELFRIASPSLIFSLQRKFRQICKPHNLSFQMMSHVLLRKASDISHV